MVLPLCIDTNTKIGDMTPARTLSDGNAQVSDDAVINTGDKLFDAGLFGESCLPHLAGRMRNL